jgi:phosphonoacetaldehyde hydrolase
MSFVYQRSYRGPLKAVVLDWAGTVVDFGCLAPTATFVEAFRQAGIAITQDQARGPMGLPKWDHVEAILRMEEVQAAWRKAHGKPSGKSDVDAIYSRVLPLQVTAVAKHAALIPGALEAVRKMRKLGLAIATTTGYPRLVMDVLCRLAKKQGYQPDSMACAGDLPKGRPGPFLAWKALSDLQIDPVAAVVKIGDTVADIEEGLNGGMWTIGLSVQGNEVGLSLAEWTKLPKAAKASRRAKAELKLSQAGAHYVVDTLADVFPCLEDIDLRLASGDRP